MYCLFELPDDVVTFAYFNFEGGCLPTMEAVEDARNRYVGGL